MERKSSHVSLSQVSDVLGQVSTLLASHTERLLALQEESAARFIQTNDMVRDLVAVVESQKTLLVGFADRLDRMTTLHAEQAQRIETLNHQIIQMMEAHESRLADLIAKVGCRPTTTNNIQ